MSTIIASINKQNPDITTDPRYFFYDLNGKVNWRVGERDRVYLSFFNGKDDFGLASTERFGVSQSSIDFGLDWFNSVAAARWNHEWTPKLFSNLTVTRSEYTFNTGIEFSETENTASDSTTQRFNSLYRSGIVDHAARMDFNYALNNTHYLRFGGNLTLHWFNPGATTFQAEFGQDFPGIDTTLGAEQVRSAEQFLYLEDEMHLSDHGSARHRTPRCAAQVNGASFTSLQPRSPSITACGTERQSRPPTPA